jgi:glycosidase
MIHTNAISHRPLSSDAYAVDETLLVFRLRSAIGDLDQVRLCHGDTAYRGNPVAFTTVPMTKVHTCDRHDHYEARISAPHRRTVYYFELVQGQETLYYYADEFHQTLSVERNDLFKFPYLRHEDILTPPAWLSQAVIYNIFPDSFVGSDAQPNTTTIRNGFPIKNRLGGTLSAVIERLDYIQKLGCNTIYLNPIFTGGEYHKYDVIDYKTIDPLFGTNADFKRLVDLAHAKNMRVIIDGVFNHSGWHFFAFQDVLRHQEQSRYRDWYYDLSFPVVVPSTHEETPTYACFGYERHMPKLNTSHPEVIDYFTTISTYWIEEYDIDGWRLDVADEVDDGFWRAFYQTSKTAKPDIAIIGEVWQDASHHLDLELFDSVMNYDFLKHAKAFFAQRTIDANTYASRLIHLDRRYREQHARVLLNLLDSHDVPRFLSHLDGDKDRYRLAVLVLLTSVGAPSILYGDEQGLMGIREIDYRTAMVYDQDPDLWAFFQRLIALRTSNAVFHHGFFRVIEAEEAGGLLVFERYDETHCVRIAINHNDTSRTLTPPDWDHAVLWSSQDDTTELKPHGFILYQSTKEDSHGRNDS